MLQSLQLKSNMQLFHKNFLLVNAFRMVYRPFLGMKISLAIFSFSFVDGDWLLRSVFLSFLRMKYEDSFSIENPKLPFRQFRKEAINTEFEAEITLSVSTSPKLSISPALRLSRVFPPEVCYWLYVLQWESTQRHVTIIKSQINKYYF